ncbi:hypothetical protein [Streptomyces sp. NPDC050560]|uniref:hypothetical protein n=1 Tax=Streptomyces sp. NPDC050560 TaxID=3365630 RepID=UPI00379142AC
MTDTDRADEGRTGAGQSDAGRADTGRRGAPGRAGRALGRGTLAAVVAAAVVVVVAGVAVYFNTNVGTPGRICHGWVRTSDAAAVLGGGGPGRVTASEDSPDTCTVRRHGWLQGTGGELVLRRAPEPGSFPFYAGDWEVSGTRHVLSGGTHGAYGASRGWVLLPRSCDGHRAGDDRGRALTADITEGGPAEHPADLGRLLTAAGQRLSGESCDGSGKHPATRDTAPAPERAADLGRVCGIDGFALRGVRGPKGEPVRESVTGTAERGLYCDLAFEGDREGPFARVAVVGDTAFAAALDGRGFTRARCAGRETVFAYDLRHMDDDERAATRLPEPAGFARTFGTAARAAAHCTDTTGGAP